MLSFRIPYLLLLLLPLSVISQRTAYTYFSQDRDEDYSFAVIGAVGSNIHIWETPRFNPSHTPTKTSVHIFVLSEDMRLVGKKDILLDKDPVSQTYAPIFEYHDHSYFVSIRYKVWLADRHSPRSLLLEIAENGDIIQRISNLELVQAPPLNQATPRFSTTSRDQTLYAVIAGGDLSTRHLTVRKTPIGDTSISEQKFSVRTYRLSFPRITLTDDSTLWVACLAEPGAKNLTDGGSKDLLFLARLDTNLSTVDQPRLAPFYAPPHNKDENYIPEYILPSDSNLFIISTGRTPNVTPYYRPSDIFPRIFDPRYPDYAGSHMIGTPMYRSDFPPFAMRQKPRSLRISLAAPSLSILLDTIIDAHANGATLELDNYFYGRADDGIFLMYSQQYVHNTHGIRYFHIDPDGGIEDRDMIVDVHYHYLLSLAKRISPSTLVVPFTYKGKMGFQKVRPRMN